MSEISRDSQQKFFLSIRLYKQTNRGTFKSSSLGRNTARAHAHTHKPNENIRFQVLGVSSYFRFDVQHSNCRSLELECLVPVSKLRSTSVSDFGIFLGNNKPSSTSLDARTVQTSSIHSFQNLVRTRARVA